MVSGYVLSADGGKQNLADLTYHGLTAVPDFGTLDCMGEIEYVYWAWN